MRKYISFFIILSITAFVSVAATVIVSASVQDTDSNIRVTEKFISRVASPSQVDAVAEQPTPMPALANGAKGIVAGIHEVQCANATTSAGPIGKYLKNKSLPTTRAYREQLAEEFHIASYSGTVNQNTELLKYIVQKERRELGCDINSTTN